MARKGLKMGNKEFIIDMEFRPISENEKSL